MKKLLLVSFYIQTTLFIFAQTGSRYPIDSTSVWRVDHIRNGVSDEQIHVEGDEIYKYFIKGDTVINTNIFFKVFKTGTHYLDAPFYYENVYCGALRDKNNKFWFVKKNETDEVLLYDFNANVDDTIHIQINRQFESKVVSYVDTLPDGRKISHFNPKEPIIGCGDQYIIEGIGGSGGLLEGPACFHFWTFDNHLVCYTQQGGMVYHNNNPQLNCELVSYQNLTKYLDPTCVWRLDKQVLTDTISNFEKINYFICGDTTIGSKNYMKLCKTGARLYIEENGTFFSGINEGVYTGALREQNRHIYFITDGRTEEILLYNFNLNEGDKLDGSIFYQDTVKIIDTILDNRLIFYTGNNRWENYILEGIGSDKGFLEEKTEFSKLVCFMKNRASVYHNGTGSECVLSYDQYDFFGCDKFKIVPDNPSASGKIKLVSRFCYQISYNHSVPPVISEKNLNSENNSIYVELYCNYDDQNITDSTKIVYPVFDTLEIGYLPAGNYNINIQVHTVHRNGNLTDTSFCEKDRYLTFKVSQSATFTPDQMAEAHCKIYPVPAKDYLILELPGSDYKIREIEIYNITGIVVKRLKITDFNPNDQIKINVGQFEDGIYIIRIKTDKVTFSKKFTIEK